jgi:RNA polymerase sigma factor (sigma-70 family)
MSDGVKRLDEQRLQELLERHTVSNAQDVSLNELHSVAQEAYSLGWTDHENEPARRAQQLEDLLQDEARLRPALDRLTSTERQVVELRFGLVDADLGRNPQLDKVAKELGVSRERVRQLERSAIEKMLVE